MSAEVLQQVPPKVTRPKRQQKPTVADAPKTEYTDAQLEQLVEQYMQRKKNGTTTPSEKKPIRRVSNKVVAEPTTPENQPQPRAKKAVPLPNGTKSEKVVPPASTNATIPKFGTKDQVWRGECKMTKGGLSKEDLMVNAKGKVISKRAYECGVRLIQKLKEQK